MEQLHPSEIDLGLDRIAAVARRLGIQKKQAKVITVGGTNGKGSCVATLERFFIKSGKGVGAYTSPHLLRYNERIKVNGRQVEDSALCRYFALIDGAREDISLTYFEFGTLAALLAFDESGLDYWILEVGLGGRLDAVNIMDPDIAVITSIDFDHEQWLGETREAIATEKFGILRSEGLLVCAEEDLPLTAQSIVNELNCTMLQLGQEFSIAEHDQQYILELNAGGSTCSVQVAKECVHLPQKSVAAALQVLQLLGQLPASEVCANWLSELQLMGRFERVTLNDTNLILDVAHNPAAVYKLASQLSGDTNQDVFAVVAMMADKKISTALKALEHTVSHWFCAQIPFLPRSASSEQLAGALVECGVDVTCISQFSSVESALKKAMSDAQKKEITILVFGSFYTVADAHQYLSHHSG